MALGKCVSIENITVTLEDCDGSSQVGSAWILCLFAAAMNSD